MPLDIKVFGSGCPTCKRLHERAQEAAKELGLDENIEYVTDIGRLLELGVMQSPVMTIGGELVIVGYLPDTGEIKEAISERLER